jgi:hypothetical protein
MKVVKLSALRTGSGGGGAAAGGCGGGSSNHYLTPNNSVQFNGYLPITHLTSQVNIDIILITIDIKRQIVLVHFMKAERGGGSTSITPLIS